jgi:hypothetical protein
VFELGNDKQLMNLLGFPFPLNGSFVLEMLTAFLSILLLVTTKVGTCLGPLVSSTKNIQPKEPIQVQTATAGNTH